MDTPTIIPKKSLSLPVVILILGTVVCIGIVANFSYGVYVKRICNSQTIDTLKKAVAGSTTTEFTAAYGMGYSACLHKHGL